MLYCYANSEQVFGLDDDLQWNYLVWRYWAGVQRSTRTKTKEVWRDSTKVNDRIFNYSESRFIENSIDLLLDEGTWGLKILGPSEKKWRCISRSQSLKKHQSTWSSYAWVLSGLYTVVQLPFHLRPAKHPLRIVNELGGCF